MGTRTYIPEYQIGTAYRAAGPVVSGLWEEGVFLRTSSASPSVRTYQSPDSSEVNNVKGTLLLCPVPTPRDNDMHQPKSHHAVRASPIFRRYEVLRQPWCLDTKYRRYFGFIDSDTDIQRLPRAHLGDVNYVVHERDQGIDVA